MKTAKTLPLHPTPQDAFNGLIESLAVKLGDEARAEIREVITQEIGQLKSYLIEKPLTVNEAAANYLGVSSYTVYRWIKAGDLPPAIVHKTKGNVYFFFPSELRDFIKSL